MHRYYELWKQSTLLVVPEWILKHDSHSHCMIVLQHLSDEDLPFYSISLIEILQLLFRTPGIVQKMVRYPDRSEDIM